MDSVKSIGQSAFLSTNLTKLTIPDTVEYIGSYILNMADKLESLTVSLSTLQK